MSEFNSYARYTGDGQQADFTVPFPYLAQGHVHVTVNGVLQFVVWPTSRTVSFPNGAPAEGAIIEIQRKTPLDAREVVYSDASKFRAKDLNTDSQQLLYLVQEVRDGLYGALFADDMEGISGGDPESIVDEVTTRVVETELYKSLQEEIERINGIDSSIQDTSTHVASVDALAENLGYDAEDLAEASIRGYLRDDDSLSRVRILSKRSDDNAASIVEEQTVRADADSALASDITTVQTSVDGNTASIQTNAESVDGLKAQYTVKIDTGNRVVGFGLASDGTDDTSGGDDFIVRSNNFSVIDPDTDELQIGWDSTINTFVVNGELVVDGTIKANKLDITDVASISPNLGVITAGTFKTTASSTGRRVEISDSGSYPFWYGAGSKTESNATMYLDADGNAMYRGGLDVASSSTEGSVEIKDNVIKVFDENGALRVQLGDLSA